MTFRNPESVHAPLASYSHHAEVNPGAKWLVLSGQVGMGKDGCIPEDTIAQVEMALDNILLNLQAAGMDKDNLVKLVFYFVGQHDAGQRRMVIDQKLGEHAPCMTVIYVAGLASDSLKVEIDAWACQD